VYNPFDRIKSINLVASTKPVYQMFVISILKSGAPLHISLLTKGPLRPYLCYCNRELKFSKSLLVLLIRVYGKNKKHTFQL